MTTTATKELRHMLNFGNSTSAIRHQGRII